MMNAFTAVYERDGAWWIGYVEELPGANSQGKTIEEVRRNLKEAVELILDANKKLARRASRGRRVIREELRIASK